MSAPELPADADVIEALIGVLSGWASPEQRDIVIDYTLRRNVRLIRAEKARRVIAAAKASAAASTTRGNLNGQH